MTQAAPQAAGTTANTISMLVVVCGPSLLAMPADIVRGILEPEEAGPGPTVRAYGLDFPISNVAGEFGLWRPSAPPEPRVILCERQQRRRAIHVDRVVGLAEVPQNRVRSLPAPFAGCEREWFAGLFDYGDDVALLVNPLWLLHAPTLAEADPPGAGGEIERPQESMGPDVVDLRRSADREDAPWRQR